MHFNVTTHPTAQWTAQQLVEAFPSDSAPRYLLRDRDAIYGEKVRRRIKSLGIEEVVTAPATARLARRGKIRSLNELSGPYAETVLITSLSSTSDICDGFFENTLIIIIPAGLTCR